MSKSNKGQFEKGHKKLPGSGRPKGTGRPTFDTIVEQLKKNPGNPLEWQSPDFGKIDCPYQQAILQLTAAMQNGESWAICEMLNRGFGKPSQALTFDPDNVKELQIIIRPDEKNA